MGASKPSYTAFKFTPDSLLPGDLGGLQSETILYIESAKAGVEGKETIDGSDLVFRHNGRSVIVFADGHINAWNYDQVAAIQGLMPPQSEEERRP